MVAYAKFLPPDDLPAFHQTFWESVRAHKLALQCCNGCGTFRFIPMEICPQCHSESDTWRTVSGLGEIYTYTIVHRGPTAAYNDEAPYPIVHVTLDEGPRMISNLVGIALEAIHIGMRVRVIYEDVTADHTIFKFAPA